jgi:putative spermidine/putrescine transport system ATP-binding protein
LPEQQAAGQSLLLSVRPERISLALGDAAKGIAGRIVGAVFRGNYAAYQVEVPSFGRELFVYRQADGPLGSTTYHLGQAVTLDWAPQDGVVVSAE